MKSLLKIEYKKFLYSYSLWVIIAVLVLSSCLSVFSNVYEDSLILSKTLYADSMVLLIAGAIYAGLCVTPDFANGFIRHSLVVCKRRVYIIFAKFIHFIGGCVILLVIYPLVTVLISIFYYNFQNPMLLIKDCIFDMLRVLPYYCTMFSIFFMIAILSKRDGITLGITIPLSILLVVFTERLLPNLDFLKYTPIIQIQEILENGINNTIFLLSIIVCGILIGLSILVSVLKFRYDEF